MTKKNAFSCRLHAEGRVSDLTVYCDRLIAMGFTARDEETMRRNLDALKKIGVKIPDRIPMVYACLNSILTADGSIEVVGGDTNGEVESVLIIQGDDIYVGVGSDHADKKLEAVSIPKSKQVCAKHMGLDLWRYEDVIDHWDRLELSSVYTVNGEKIQYQQGLADSMLRPEKVLEEVRRAYPETQNLVVFGGSIPKIGDFLFGEHFSYAIHDPVLGRSIASEYDICIIGPGE